MKNKAACVLITFIIMFTSAINVQAANVTDTTFSVYLTANTYSTLSSGSGNMQKYSCIYISSAPAEYVDVQIWSGNFNITKGNTITIKCKENVCIDNLIRENYPIYENNKSLRLRLKCNKSGKLRGVLSCDIPRVM